MEQLITLKFSLQQLAILDEALGKLTYRDAAPLVADINIQITNQKNDLGSENIANRSGFNKYEKA